MKYPIISIDRRAKSYAIFDGAVIQGKFVPYVHELDAIKEARRLVATLTDKEPTVVFPRLKSSHHYS